MIKQSITALALCSALATPPLLAAPSTFVHLFEWSWSDVAYECERYLGPKGYAAVQVSPPSEHIQGEPWWTRYQPVSYQLISRSGDRAAFTDMVARCKQVGVDIYVDAVINHMANGAGVGVAGSSFGVKSFPMYSNQDFHNSCPINGEDYANNAWRVQNCELVGLPDLNTSSTYVQTQLANYLNDLLSLGVAGFRLDASKHMAANDIADVMSRLSQPALIFQEVIDQGGEAVPASDYFGNGLVTEFKYSTKLGETFKFGKLAWLRQFGEAWGMMPSANAVVFVDNHDNQRGHGGAGSVVTFKDGKLYDLANVFMLAYPYGYPKVMSSYQFAHSDDGAPNVPVHDGNTLHCEANSWQCEHRKQAIAGAVAFRNNTLAAWQVNHWWDNGNNQIAFARGNLGFVAINRESYSMAVQLQTGLSAGDYCDVLSGELNTAQDACSGTRITVASDGTAHINLPAMSALAIHHASKVTSTTPSNWQRTVVFIQAQTQTGQDMFIRGGIDHGFALSLGKQCDVNSLACALPIRYRNQLNVTSAAWKMGDQYLNWQGRENAQPQDAEGSPLDWTTNQWPQEWGAKRSYESDGFGEMSLNQWGSHYWLLDVDMDCNATYNGWFELKAFVKNGQGWEGNINQAERPYASNNHFAQCGRVNVFEFANSSFQVLDF
ncbi:alpha-amylase family protein [Pseudoalteromonas fenneropenaei]|uniref:Alpha-amylase n=1 Tax=Pseudoalteromonas fenneropenaei TaxID=1737459 RepID=A0ABV7CG97_9GAMM